MLKLEKQKSRDISITMRDKNKRLNKTFLYAFSIAVGMHLLAVLIFHIHSILVSDVVLPPTLVEIDANSLQEDTDPAILALTDPDGRLQRHVLAPTPSTPQLPSVEAPQIARELEYLQVLRNSENPFRVIEDDWQFPTETPHAKTFEPISIHLTGELAKLKLLNANMVNAMLFPIPKSEMVIYHVQIERKSGKIFWFLAEQLPTNKKLQEKAETILRSMEFEQDSLAFVTSGDIEILFNGPERML